MQMQAVRENLLSEEAINDIGKGRFGTNFQLHRIYRHEDIGAVSITGYNAKTGRWEVSSETRPGLKWMLSEQVIFNLVNRPGA